MYNENNSPGCLRPSLFTMNILQVYYEGEAGPARGGQGGREVLFQVPTGTVVVGAWVNFNSLSKGLSI